MLGGLQRLALEVKYPDRVQAFYEAFLDRPVRRETDREVTLGAGEADLVLRAPGDPPRGGLHTHYAAAIPFEEYDTWRDRLASRFDIVEHSFGDARSLYLYDPAGNCVELGTREVAGPGVDGVFEVVLEVADIDTALAFYEPLGFRVVERADDERRVRTTTGSLDLELWEPRLGLADARGGVHVEFAVTAEDPATAVESVSDDAVESVDGGFRLSDPDGHTLTLVGG